MISRLRCVLMGANITGSAFAAALHQQSAAYLMGACALVFFAVEVAV